MKTTLATVQSFFPAVKKVMDANRNARVEVTSKDVALSKKMNHKECAMAIACKKKFHLDGVIISRSVAYLIKGTQARRFKVGPSVSREIVSFDRGAGFAEGSYELAKISKTNRSDAVRNPARLNPDRSHVSKSIQKRFMHRTTNIRNPIIARSE